MSVGKALKHESAVQHVRGKAVYVDDQSKIEGMLSCWPVVVEWARAKIISIDTKPALVVPGVVTVLTAKDIKGQNQVGTIVHDEVLLPSEESYYANQAVAWVVAESEDAARIAAAKVVLKTKKLKPIVTIKEAIKKKSFHGNTQRMAKGNPKAALKETDHVISGEFEMKGQDHFYLETHASWVIPDGEGHYTVYSSTQHPSETQATVAHVLGIPANNVVCVMPRMGGGFGGKESQAAPIAAVAALAAQKTGKPVRVQLSRELDMKMTGKRHPVYAKYKVGYNKDGTIKALDIDIYSDAGWSTDLSHAIMQRTLFHIDNAYYIEHLDVRGWICKTNKTSQTAFRGFGGPQSIVLIENIIDDIARKLGLPAETIREKNFYKDGQETHYGQVLSDVRLQKVWSKVKKNSAFSRRKAQIAKFNKENSYKKRGLGITPLKFGISFTFTILNQAGAFVLIYTDGSIQLNHGGTEMGQGLHTKMLQVAASTLGVNIERFRIMPTATDKVPNTSATAASSGSDLNGQAVKAACETLKSRLAEVAARMLNLNAPEELIFKDDYVYSNISPKERISFDDLIAQAYFDQVSLSATGYYRTPNIYFDMEAGKGVPFYYFSYAAAVSEVEIDSLTGELELRRVDIVHDVGESLNPNIDKGQIEGGFVQGLGWLTSEEFVWNDAGQILTFAPSTYKIPTIAEIPEHFEIELLEKAAQKGVIYGSKAIGEPPFMTAVSVREAIKDAVAAFAVKNGPVKLALPATPEAILEAIDAVR